MFARCKHILMHVISEKALRLFWEKHTDAETALRSWLKVTERASWKHLADARRDFPHADAVRTYTIFNIKGYEYRLVTAIHYNRKRVYIRYVFTHPEYDRWSAAQK
jgi:mRNA interferase HigB